MTETLHLWTIYQHPRDFPDEFVARLYLVPGGPNFGATSTILRGATLEAVRAQLPPDLYNMGRQPEDDACIVETWI
jgi:hypothetical protein